MTMTANPTPDVLEEQIKDLTDHFVRKIDALLASPGPLAPLIAEKEEFDSVFNSMLDWEKEALRQNDRAQAAEAEVERLRAALAEIAEDFGDYPLPAHKQLGDTPWFHMADEQRLIAVAALSPKPPEGGES